MTIEYQKAVRTELTPAELETVAGGHPFEESFADIALYRAGVSYVNTVFGSDEYYIGSTRISKELAKSLRSRSSSLWKSSYAESGNYVSYAKEWKKILANEYGISWDGLMGSYSCQAW